MALCMAKPSQHLLISRKAIPMIAVLNRHYITLLSTWMRGDQVFEHLHAYCTKVAMRSYFNSLFGCLVVVACLCASGLALILPRSVPRQPLGKSPLLRWKSGTTCSTARASNNEEHGRISKPLSLVSSKVPSSTLLMTGMFGNIMPTKPAAAFKQAAPKLKTTKLLPQKAPSTLFGQIRQKLGANKKTAEVVRKGVKKVAKQNQKLVKRSVENFSPVKAKAAASRLIQQAQRRAFLTKVGLAAAVLYLVWTFGIKELLRGWEKKELKVWVDAIDDLDYYEVRKEPIPAEDSTEPSLEQQQPQQKEEYWWSSPLPSNTSTQLFAPDMATSVQRSLGTNQTNTFLSALRAAWKRILVNAQRPTDLAQALQGSAFRAQLAEALLDAAPVGTFPGEVVSVISDALIESDVPHLPQPGKTLQLQQLLAAVRVEWLQSPNPAESFARVVTALLVVLVDKAVETIVQGREPAATFAALTEVTDLIKHAEILYTRLIPAHIELPFVQYHGAAKSHQLEQLYVHFLDKTHKECAGPGQDAEQVQAMITNLAKLQVILRITDVRRTVIEQQYLSSIVENHALSAPKYEREDAYVADQEVNKEEEKPSEDDKLLSEIAPKFQPAHSAVFDEPAGAAEEAGETLWSPAEDTTVVEERSMTQAEAKTGTEGDSCQTEEFTRVDYLGTETAVADAQRSTQAITETSPPDEGPAVSVTIDTTSTSGSSEVTIPLETIATDDDDDDIFGDSSSEIGEDGIAAVVEIPGAAADPTAETIPASSKSEFVHVSADNVIAVAVDVPVGADDASAAVVTPTVMLSSSSTLMEGDAVVTKPEGGDGIIASVDDDSAVVNVATAAEVSNGLEIDINIETTTAPDSSIVMEANENMSVLAEDEGDSAATVDIEVPSAPTADVIVSSATFAVEESVVEANEQAVVVEVEGRVENHVCLDSVEHATGEAQANDVMVDDSVKHVNGGGHTDFVASIVGAVSDVTSEPVTAAIAETEDTIDTGSSATSVPEAPTNPTPIATSIPEINTTTTTTTTTTTNTTASTSTSTSTTTSTSSNDLFDSPFDEVVQGRSASLTQALQDSTFRALLAQALVERIPHGTFSLETATTLSEALLQADVDQIESLTGKELLKKIQQAVEKEELTPLQTAEGLAQVATALAVLLVDRALPTLAHISHTSTVDALDVLTDFLTRAGNLYMSLVAEEVTVAPIEYTGGASLSRLEDLYYRYTKAAVAASVHSQPSKTADSSGSGNNDSGVKMSHMHVLKLQKLQTVLKVSRQRRAKVEQRVIAEHKAAMMENQSSGGASDNKATSNISTSPQPPQQQQAHSNGASTSTSTSMQRNHAHKQGMPPHNKLGGSGSGSGSSGAGNIKNVPQAKWGAGMGFGAPKKPISRPVVHEDEAATGEEVRGQKKMASTGSGPTLTNEQRHQLENMNPEFFEEIQVRLATGRIDLREVLILEKTLGFTVNSAVRSLELAPGTKLRRLHSALGQSHGDVVDIFRKLAALKEGK